MTSFSATRTTPALPNDSTPTPDHSGVAGITGGYNGNSLGLEITIALLPGLAVYNAIELIVLIFSTFNKFKGLYFWSLLIATLGIFPYSIGLVLKFFQLLGTSHIVDHISITILSIGWSAMVTGQSVVLWSRLHLITTSRRVLQWSLYMIIIDGILLHSITTSFNYVCNSRSLSPKILARFVRGYNLLEKVQLVGFCIQEMILSAIYIKETVQIIRLSESVTKRNLGETVIIDEDKLNSRVMRRVLNQLIVINAIVIAMDFILLGVEFADLYLIQTTLKGTVYSIKLKLEFAVLGKLVQLVRTRTMASRAQDDIISSERCVQCMSSTLEKSPTGMSMRKVNSHNGGESSQRSFLRLIETSHSDKDITLKEPQSSPGLDAEQEEPKERPKMRGMTRTSLYGKQNWIDEEMDRHNIK